jgi:hypothetical protein
VSNMIQLMGWTGLDSALLVACVTTVLLILPIRMGKEQKQVRLNVPASPMETRLGSQSRLMALSNA